jgi:hypothetical protein
MCHIPFGGSIRSKTRYSAHLRDSQVSAPKSQRARRSAHLHLPRQSQPRWLRLTYTALAKHIQISCVLVIVEIIHRPTFVADDLGLYVFGVLSGNLLDISRVDLYEVQRWRLVLCGVGIAATTAPPCSRPGATYSPASTRAARSTTWNSGSRCRISAGSPARPCGTGR